jgi:peptidoglycan/xylan/chitin deacetylase (PgdA/CDA1 family)/glycosyltransferase involved in cell wall biosynthesis
VAQHVARRPPRAHGLLLALGLWVLLAALAVDGYAAGAAGGSGEHSPPSAPAGVTGPVIRWNGAEPVTRTMPARTVALTFDDGPDPQWTPAVLDALRRHGAHATFFVVGSRVNAHPELVRRILAEGHEIGSHTFSHADLASVPAWRRDLESTLAINAIAGATSRHATLFRPPYSSRTADLTRSDLDVLREVGRRGQIAVVADRDSNDWRRPGIDPIIKAATPTGTAGAIVLMHDGGGDRSQTVAALDRLLPALAGRGYRFTTVSEGIGLPDSMPAASAGDRLRGTALRWTQGAAGAVAAGMRWLLVGALVLGITRLLVQAWSARVHVRRGRRTVRRGLVHAPVSVIVPACNEAANIVATVRSLLASHYPAIEVIVVDDGSTDGTAALVHGLRLPGVQVIRQPNLGKPAALNAGIRRARHGLVVLVDGDTVVQPDTIFRLVQPFVDPRVGAVSGNTKVANRRRLLGRWQHLEYVVGFNLDRRMFALMGCIPTIPGAVGAFRRRVLADVCGVPADTRAEDTDLTMAILRAGWEVAYEARAIAWTEAPATMRQLWRQRYRWGYGTMQAMWKHRRSFLDRGPGGHLGRRGLPYLAVFQILLPLTAPAVDVYAIYVLVVQPGSRTAAAWVAMVVIQAATAAYALRLDGERLGPLWSLPFQQFVYRQVMYLVVVQAAVTALLGSRLGWHHVARTGAAADLVGSRR